MVNERFLRTEENVSRYIVLEKKSILKADWFEFDLLSGVTCHIRQTHFLGIREEYRALLKKRLLTRRQSSILFPTFPRMSQVFQDKNLIPPTNMAKSRRL